MSRDEDEAAIYRLSCHYAEAFDENDGDLLASLFTPDGTIEAPNGQFAGTEALRSAPAIVAARYLKTFHLVANQTVELAGDRANGTTYGVARHLLKDDRGASFCREMTLRYADAYVRNAGQWYFETRRLLLEWVHEYPVQPS